LDDEEKNIIYIHHLQPRKGSTIFIVRISAEGNPFVRREEKLLFELPDCR